MYLLTYFVLVGELGVGREEPLKTAAKNSQRLVVNSYCTSDNLTHRL